MYKYKDKDKDRSDYVEKYKIKQEIVTIMKYKLVIKFEISSILGNPRARSDLCSTFSSPPHKNKIRPPLPPLHFSTSSANHL